MFDIVYLRDCRGNICRFHTQKACNLRRKRDIVSRVFAQKLGVRVYLFAVYAESERTAFRTAFHP